MATEINWSKVSKFRHNRGWESTTKMLSGGRVAGVVVAVVVVVMVALREVDERMEMVKEKTSPVLC